MSARHAVMVLVAAVTGAVVALVMPMDSGSHDPRGSIRETDGRLEELNLGISSRQAAVLRERATGADGAIETRPEQPDYDPLVLSTVFERAPAEIHAEEPVVEEFARRRTRFLTETLRADLAEHFSDARVAAVDCRASSCKIEVIAPLADGRAIYDYVQLPPLADEQQPTLHLDQDEGRATVSMTVLFSAQNRDHDAYERGYSVRRAELIRELGELGVLVPSE